MPRPLLLGQDTENKVPFSSSSESQSIVGNADLVPVVEDRRPRQREQQQLVLSDQIRAHQRGQVALVPPPQVALDPPPQVPGQLQLAVGRVQELDGLSALYAVRVAGQEDARDQQVHAGGVEEGGHVLGRGALGDADQDSGTFSHSQPTSEFQRYQRTQWLQGFKSSSSGWTLVSDLLLMVSSVPFWTMALMSVHRDGTMLDTRSTPDSWTPSTPCFTQKTRAN
ncbi:hypothetical protein EYF80_002576 [Liparis tanakae]|uniref:Uncharacterized protein n=1 Tax=Liparis tanakae TaxID=230148 RepID=A0A4Z2JAJ8_9TELE|nr:hypothetical protein EYF80_002576 [Liparis tanakae]